MKSLEFLQKKRNHKMGFRQAVGAIKCSAFNLAKVGAGASRILSAVWKTTLSQSTLTHTARQFSAFSSPSAVSTHVTQKISQNIRLETLAACRYNPAVASLLAPDIPLVAPARGRARIFYQPSAWKRVNKHGIEKRLRTQGGIEVLWRRFLKKRHCLTPFDRILPGTYGGKILPDHHLKYNQHLVNRELRKKIEQTIKAKLR